MGVPYVKHELIALFLRPVAHAHDFEALFKALCHAQHHVVDERTGQAMQRAVTLVIRRTLYRKHAVILLDEHIFINLCGKLTLRSLDRHVVALVNRDCHSRRDCYRKFSDSRHLLTPHV
ncbi:hypothetical protein SDC9_158616 [bioreactor metagenome]|uniref:Uncharacterized protein n=1 Tax=bioreactor metagenome TaxID=1076179 RepID=A0A645FAA6_9ZZZZ